MDIAKYGDPVLSKKAIPVKAVTPALRTLAHEMLAKMYEADGVGLAAEQIGRTEALCVIDVPPSAQGSDASLNAAVRMPMIMFNPVVSAAEGSQRGSEGCLSFPGISAQITRARSVTVDWMGEDGKHYSARVHGLLARAVQHEVDHLSGIVFVDRVSATQSVLLRGKLSRLKKETSAALRKANAQ
ncbi:MAG: peptide deformylase [Kiritimatiellae bacterium]|nr:peptide deformylase [Kiritimatiellia bacterium]